MNQGSTLFAQLFSHCSRFALDRCIQRYRGNHRVRSFSCRDQFLVMAFAQLTYRESLRDIEACLGAVPERLYHMGIRGAVSRTTLADANERRDWRIYADFAQVLISEARHLYAGEALELELEQTVHALDSTTIELCLELFPWARVAEGRAAVKLHTLLDLRGNIPAYACITPANFADPRILDVLIRNRAPFTSWTAATSVSSGSSSWIRPEPPLSRAPRRTRSCAASTPGLSTAPRA
jgi:hypothetical protein